MAREEGLPGFLDFAVLASTLVVLDVAFGAVDLAEIGVADAQEVRTQAPYGDLGNVREGLADGTAEEEAAHLLIEGCHIGILDCRPGLLLQVIDAVEFPRDDREDGDHNAHSAEHSIIDCLPGFQRVLDGLVIAIKTPVVRLDGACLDDDEGQARHEEAEEVQADEQHPLAAALPRVVIERRAAAVLALRDDSLVVLVVLHGAGQDAPRLQPHTQTPGSPPDRGFSGRGGRVRPRCPASKGRRWCFLLPGAPPLFLSQPRIVRKSKGKRVNSRAETSAALRCSGRAELACPCAKQRGGSAGARPPSSAAGCLMNGSCAEPSHLGALPQLLLSSSSCCCCCCCCCCRRRRRRCDRLGLFSALLFHEVL
uniref:Phospholipid phosphatase 3 isoform X1 n=1 Tax=Sus scrofa TaxID=9823 RepID=A0A480HWQ9_PIG